MITVNLGIVKLSELDVGNNLPLGARAQVSYLEKQEVPYGTLGSVRPDFCIGNTCSIEVKNYNIASNQSGLIRNISQQAIERYSNLPDGMTQTITIDIRGQNVSASQMSSIIKGIVEKSNGIIKPTDIGFKNK